jgi:LysM repeat protein
MMRRTLLVAALALLATAHVSAQEEMRTVDGATYIVHTVTKGETLFGIGQHYALPIPAITKANPGAAQGLSIGQVLLLPVAAQQRKELRRAPELKDGELLHTVARKETLYGIARRYGVPQEALQRRNPELAQGLRPGMVLRVPQATSTAAPPAALLPAVNDSSRAHEVLPGETLYGLAKRYGVPPELITKANGGLPGGLRVGMYLRIPAGEPKAVTPLPPATTASSGHVWQVALMLPFSADDVGDSVTVSDEQLASVTQAAVEFNAGAAMALDTLREQGLHAEVHVFDTGDSPSSWEPLMRSDSVRGMDLYIGPFHRAAVESLTRVAGGAPIVCPVPQSNKVLLGNPTVSKVVSGRPDQVLQLARYVAYHHARDNIVLCMANIFGERELQGQMRRQLEEALHVGQGRDSVPVALCARRDISAAIALLDPARPNAVVVPSEDVEFVTTVVNQLAGRVGKFVITVYGMAGWTDINTLDVGALTKLDTHVPASSFIDYNSPQVADFVGRYRARYRNEPGEYAFLGHDVTLYYCSALMQFGSTFPEHFAEVAAAPLHLAFRLVKMGPENGWRNESAVMLEYGDAGIRPAQ